MLNDVGLVLGPGLLDLLVAFPFVEGGDFRLLLPDDEEPVLPLKA